MTPLPGKVWLIGAGPGDPELLTVRAVRALEKADVVVVDHRVQDGVLAWTRPGVEVIDAGKQAGKPCITQEQINRLLVSRARAGQQVARLKSGDPFVFGRGAEEAEALIAAGLDWEVVPGISAGIAAPAYAGIPLLHRQHASSVAFVTGHAHGSAMTLGEDADTLVIFMCAATIVPIARALIQRGRLPTTPVALIRNGTLPAQDVRVGTLDELAACTESFSPPLIAVVGEVARLAQGLHWFGAPPRPLSRPMRRMA
ncbi:MAG: hypothetical protein NVSMB23_20360 [Myxococcales bacterium]